MGPALILDAEALSALAHGPARRRVHVMAAMMVARDRGGDVVIPDAVLVEVYRGRRQDAGIDALFAREAFREIAVDRRAGRIAGRILGAAGSGSELAVDAFVVAAAIEAGGGIVLTHDPEDLERLASPFGNVSVERLP